MNNKTKNRLKLITLMTIITIAFSLLFIPLSSAGECVGGSCGANMSLNVTNATIPPITNVTITTFSPTGMAIFSLLQTSGAGIGMFMNFISNSLPILFFMIALTLIIIAIAIVIFKSVGLWGKITNET